MKIVLLTGCNLGDRESNMAKAATYIEQQIGVISSISSLHYSHAWGFESDDIFVNQVVICNSGLTSDELLRQIWHIESLFGKSRGSDEQELIKLQEREDGKTTYQSRFMDIDILFYGDELIETPLLTVPHRLIREREFVLRPLTELIPNYHPIGWDESVEDALNRLKKE